MSLGQKTFYVTTPIYYVNDVPHIGHAYSTVGADVLARFKRMDGYEVFFLTGTDEHGQKIAKTAKEKGLEPQQLADQVVERFKEVWRLLGITYDRFIRTTDEDHRETARVFFKKVMDAGFIYKADYEGWYCLPDEKFLLDSEVVGGKCPDCGRLVERIKEENYFFAMSKFQAQLEQHLADHPDFIQPASRKNELINNFIQPGLSDVSITRSSVKWGIPAPVDSAATIYVWFDALINYISALGWPGGENYKKYWPADVHIIGKDILRFHATIWPTMLMAAGLPLPQRVFGTGYINMGGEKMSKSVGNVINPMDVIDRYGADALRYYLMREVVFGLDGTYTEEIFEGRFNGDLANDLGNLASRTLTMIDKYFDGKVPAGPHPHLIDPLFTGFTSMSLEHTRTWMDQLAFDVILEDYWRLIKQANKYIEISAPWNLAKNDSDRLKLEKVMFDLAEILRITAIRLSPFMPFTAQLIWERLGYNDLVETHSFKETQTWGQFPEGQKVKSGSPLFPRIVKEEKKVEVTHEDFMNDLQPLLKKKMIQYFQKNFNLKPDCGWLASSGQEYQALWADGKYGFYVRTKDKKRVIVQIDQEKLMECKEQKGMDFFLDYLSHQIQTVLGL